jgi:hypothetical protein
LDLSFKTARGRIGNQYPDYLWEIENVKGTRYADDIDVSGFPGIQSRVWGGNGGDFLKGDDGDFLYGQGKGTPGHDNICRHVPGGAGCSD